ncbi:MAG: DUF308 domain-containing protein [Clostridia bacterium]|nr:DUF308 domain-containing protein [Clostridia bacterium]
MNKKRFKDLPSRAKQYVLYSIFSVLIGLTFLLTGIVPFSILGLFIGGFVVAIGVVQVVFAVRRRNTKREDDSVLGITLILIGLILIMPGVKDVIYALLPVMISFLGVGILIETIFRLAFRRKERSTSLWIKFPLSVVLIALGIVFFLVESLIIYITYVVGLIFLGFGVYGGLRSLTMEDPDAEPENIPDYE